MNYNCRPAIKDDVSGINEIIDYFYKENLMLFKSNQDIISDLKSFIVCSLLKDTHSNAQVVGCGYLHSYSKSLVEIRSLGILPDFQGLGIGKKILQMLLNLAKKKSYQKVFLLTKEEKFFKKIGFQSYEMNLLPEKVYKDCIHCPSYPVCEEKAMIYELSL